MTRPGGRLAPWLLALAGYVLLTLKCTWPLPIRLASVVPHDPGDPLLTAWILAWNAHHVPLTAQWWNAPMFWPMTGVLALSEHMLGLSLVASPLQWLGADAIAAHNLLFLLSFPLCALAAHALAHTLTRRHDAAALAAILFAFSSYRASHSSHVHILWEFWMPLALLALHRYAHDGRRRWLALFAAMWIGQALSNSYLLLFFPILIVMWIAWFMACTPRRMAAAAATFALATVALLPVLFPYSELAQRFAFERGMREVLTYSADVKALAVPSPLVPASAILPGPGKAEQELFPGVINVVLILAGVVLSFRRGALVGRRFLLSAAFTAVAGLAVVAALIAWLGGPWRLGIGALTLVSVTSIAKPITVALWCVVLAIILSDGFAAAWRERSAFVFYVGAAMVMYVLCFGPEPTFLGHPFWYKPPYAWLMGLPGFANVRAPARFAMLAELCLPLASAIAFVRIRERLSRPLAATLAIAVLAGAIADGWIRELPLSSLPPRIASLESLQQGSVVELPIGDVFGDIAALYRSIYHHRPVVNGYSGFAPIHYVVLKVALDAGETDALGAVTAGIPLTTVDADGHTTTIAPAADEPPLAGRRLRVQSATIDDRPIDLMAITDGDRVSRWVSSTPQGGNESIVLDLGALEEIRGVTLSIGPYLGEYPRALAIETSEDGRDWTSRWSGRGASKAVAGALRNPASVPLEFSFPETHARWIRLRQLGADPHFPWSIAELSVWGR